LEHPIYSIFIGRLNKNNNFGKQVGVFIQLKVWLKRRVGQSEGGGMRRGGGTGGVEGNGL
jgi:hypothetical protein